MRPASERVKAPSVSVRVRAYVHYSSKSMFARAQRADGSPLAQMLMCRLSSFLQLTQTEHPDELHFAMPGWMI